MFSQPLTRDTPLEEYDPPENGFTVCKCFLDKTYNDSALWKFTCMYFQIISNSLTAVKFQVFL